MEQCFEVRGRFKDMDVGCLDRKVYCWAETNMTNV